MKRILSSSSFKRGFTLIEILVVLGITSLLGTLGIAGFVSFNQAQVLQSSANNVATVLGLAKSRAQSQIKPQTCISPDTLKGYGVSILADPQNSYTLFLRCSSPGPPPTDNDINIETKVLPEKVSFDADGSIFFPIQKGGVQMLGQVVVSGYGRSKNITVSSTGEISIL